MPKWQVLMREVVYSTPWGRWIERVTYLNPHTNKEDVYDLFVCPNSVIVMAMTSDSQVVTVNGFRPGVNGDIHELPAGGIKKGESPEDTARRELREETGYGNGTLHCLGEPMCFSAGISPTVFYSILVLNAEKLEEPWLNPQEPLEVILVPFENWLLMISSIRTLQAVATTMRAWQYLERLSPSPIS